MNPDDIARLLIQFAPLIGTLPIVKMMQREMAPITEELGELLRDKLRLYRYERQLELLAKAEQIARDDAGYSPSNSFRLLLAGRVASPGSAGRDLGPQ